MAQRETFQLTNIRSLKQGESIRKDVLSGITDQDTKNAMARRLESAAKRENTANKNIKDVQRSMEELNAKWPELVFRGQKISFCEVTVRLLEEISRDGAAVKCQDEVNF
jgi:predicted  nucleic acid-binding Zn-ribbon protein